MKVLGVIPARGGSKGIPGKNTRILAGKPLIAWTAEAALRSNLDRVVLSSEDPGIIDLGTSLGMDVPFVRPKKLAQDDTPGIDVAVHALETLMKDHDYQPEAVMLLQPTSPLRTTRHINEALDLLSEHPEATSVVSVVKAPHNMVPESLMRLDKAGYLHPVKAWDERDNLRQRKPVYYARNGAAIYLVRANCLLVEKSLYGGKILPYFMSREESIDIDELFDFEMCEYLLSKRPQGESG